jgi:hypothetical protein
MTNWKRGNTSRSRAAQIITGQEQLALILLQKSKEEAATLDMQLDVFEKVGKWVSIKNRIEDDGDSRITDFKSRILGGKSEADTGAAGGPGAPRKQSTPYLDAIKSRLSPADGNGTDGNSGGGRRKGAAAA